MQQSPYHSILLVPVLVLSLSLSLSLSCPCPHLILTSSLPRPRPLPSPYTPEYSLSWTLYSYLSGPRSLDFYLDPHVPSVSFSSSPSSFLTLSFPFHTYLHMLPCLGPCAPCLLLSPRTPISGFSDIPLSLFPLLYLHHLVHARSPLSTYILAPVKQSPFSICTILVSLSLIPRVPRPLEGLRFIPRKLYTSSPVHCSRRTLVSP